jgi:nitrate reductase gamma subunit
MEIVRFIVGAILPYLAVVVFMAGMSYRFYVWTNLPSPAITLFPSPPTEAANLLNTLQEALFFKSLFLGDRTLWFFAWMFHAVLALIFLGHFRVFANVDVVFFSLGMTKEAIQSMSSGVGGAAGVLILATLLFLLFRRATIARVREITGLGDYFALLLLLAIIVTGNLMRFSPDHFDLSLTRNYFAGLASFSDVTGAAVLKNNVFLTHMGLSYLLLICIPFSKLLHLGGIFFTHQLIRKN